MLLVGFKHRTEIEEEEIWKITHTLSPLCHPCEG